MTARRWCVMVTGEEWRKGAAYLTDGVVGGGERKRLDKWSNVNWSKAALELSLTGR
ncbi:hypothetical protein A2U01_0034545, partial [Trifolium medium]|nr:hypothetical protein [Trifolium medium]